MADDELSVWLERLMGGDTSAARVLWERCCESLARAARRKLPATIRRVTDEEDVVPAPSIVSLGGWQQAGFQAWNIAAICGRSWEPSLLEKSWPVSSSIVH